MDRSFVRKRKHQELLCNTTAQMISKSIIVVTVNIKKTQQTTFNYPEKTKNKKKNKTEYKVKMVDKNPPKAVPVRKTGS